MAYLNLCNMYNCENISLFLGRGSSAEEGKCAVAQAT